MKKGNIILLLGVAAILLGALLCDNSDAIVTAIFILFIGIGCVIAGIIINIHKNW